MIRRRLISFLFIKSTHFAISSWRQRHSDYPSFRGSDSHARYITSCLHPAMATKYLFLSNLQKVFLWKRIEFYSKHWKVKLFSFPFAHSLQSPLFFSSIHWSKHFPHDFPSSSVIPPFFELMKIEAATDLTLLLARSWAELNWSLARRLQLSDEMGW